MFEQTQDPNFGKSRKDRRNEIRDNTEAIKEFNLQKCQAVDSLRSTIAQENMAGQSIYDSKLSKLMSNVDFQKKHGTNVSYEKAVANYTAFYDQEFQPQVYDQSMLPKKLQKEMSVSRSSPFDTSSSFNTDIV